MRFVICFVATLSLFSVHVNAQKVAVVLSGGGAKGLAHVGVLKALEENNIPIDYIIGTSMGGVVGGFYASGYSPGQIEQIILSSEFQSWLNGSMMGKYNFYFSQKEANASWLSLNLTVDSAFSTTLNSNFANDLSLNFALAELLAQSSEKANYNFDSLFVPFRAIASDIFTQQSVVIKEGKINDALRATLTVPFFYRPIRLDKKLLFDGGVYKNFPVDITKDEFNPDVIIGVNVAAKKFTDYPFDKDEKLVAQSLLFMLLDKTDPTIIGKDGIYIEPNLQNLTAFDFPKAKAILDSGYVETLRKMEEIESKIERRITCDEVSLKREAFQLSYKPLEVKNIRLHGFPVQQRGYMRQLFKNTNGVMNIHEVRDGYYKLISEDYFENVYPGFVYNPKTGFFDFEIFGKPSPKLNVEFGGNISTREISEIYIGLDFSNFNRILFNNHLGFYTGRFYQSLQFKSRINVPYRYLFYVEPEITYNKWDFLTKQDLLFSDRRASTLRQNDSKFGINAGFPAGLKSKLLLHTSYFNNWDRFSNSNQIVSTDTLDKLVFGGFRHGIEYRKNSLNRKQYASAGESFSFAIDYITGLENYTPGNTSSFENGEKHHRDWFRAKLKVEQYFQAGWFHYGYLAEAVISNQPNFINYTATLATMPAFQPLQDSKTLFLENFRSPNYIAAGIRNVFTLKRKLDFRVEYYGMLPLQEVKPEVENSLFHLTKLTVYFAAGASAVYHSPVGPVSLNINYYDDHKNKLGAFLHVGYILFNKRSLE